MNISSQMTRLALLVVGLIVILVLASSTFGQETVQAPNQHSWSENGGWMMWRESPPSDEVRLHATFLEGKVWWENHGWMDLGDGDPSDGLHYANSDGLDFGVNVDPATGDLFGLAWQENLGWINFDTTALGVDRARYDSSTNRLRGYAWSVNAGWINLDDVSHFIAFTCHVDLNNDGAVNGSDLGILLGFWGLAGPSDLNNDATTDGADLGLLLGAWGPCP